MEIGFNSDVCNIPISQHSCHKKRNPHIKSFWKEYSFLINQGYTKYNILKFQTYRCMLYVINVTVSFLIGLHQLTLEFKRNQIQLDKH